MFGIKILANTRYTRLSSMSKFIELNVNLVPFDYLIPTNSMEPSHY